MLHIDLPTRSEIEALARERGGPCVSLYLGTSPVTQEAQAARTTLKNLARQAIGQLEAADTPKRILWAIQEEIDDLIDDEPFWRYLANSLAVFVTPTAIRSYRLPNRIENRVEVADRFHLKPLLRAITFPHNAFVLVLAEGGVKLVEISPDMPPVAVEVPDLPRDAHDALGKTTLNDRAPSGRIHGSEGKNVRLIQYCRIVDRALRPVLAGRERPLILAAADPLQQLFRQVCSYPNLAARGIVGNAERMSDSDLADRTRRLLDEIHAAALAEVAKTFDARADQGRTATDIAHAARAATFGAIDTLVVDMDSVVPGTVGDEDGRVTFADEASAATYGVVDEIAGRALTSGARVLAARQGDIPGGGPLAAILRYPI